MTRPRRRTLFAMGLLCVLAGAVATLVLTRDPVPMLHPANVAIGQLDARQIADWIASPPAPFPAQVAVWWTKREEAGLGLIHALREMGIPFVVTSDLRAALIHRQVIIFPTIDGATLDEAQAAALRRWVEGGGSLFAQNVVWGGARELFGFREVTPARTRHWISFNPGAEPVLRYLDRPEELRSRLGNERIAQIVWTNGYVPAADAQVIARFDDGSAAMLRRAAGAGTIYLAGVGFDDMIVRNQANRDYEAQRIYANGFEPGTDIWMLILRAWYEQSPRWVRLATAPDGQRSMLLLSHDLDSQPSIPHMMAFGAMEMRNHVLSTVFVQTKYKQDSIGPPLLTESNLRDLRTLKAEKFDLESHSVSHALGFNHFPLGDGAVSYASYRPQRARRSGEISGGTVLGEVCVSKALLDGELLGQDTIFFRAGHLRVPDGLPEALERCGYQFDSSFTAGDVMTGFPYVLPLGLEMDRESTIYEFPVTIEDEEPPGLAGRIDQALAVIAANADNGAINVLLVHPTEPDLKVPAEEALIRVLPAGVGVADLIDFARFWRARDQLKWRYEPTRDPAAFTLSLRPREPVNGLTFEFQPVPVAVEGLDGARLDGNRLILPMVSPGRDTMITLRYPPESALTKRPR